MSARTAGKHASLRQARLMNNWNPAAPGLLDGIQWVDSPDYGGRPEDRRIPRVYDVDPAPLARLLSVQLGTIEGDEADSMRVLAKHPDAPVHMAHLLGACEYAARKTGGSMTQAVSPAADNPFADAVQALHDGGLAGATAAFRAMDDDTRNRVLDALLDYGLAPVLALRSDLTDDMLRRPR